MLSSGATIAFPVPTPPFHLLFKLKSAVSPFSIEVFYLCCVFSGYFKLNDLPWWISKQFRKCLRHRSWLFSNYFFRTFLVQLVFHCIHSMAEDLGECPSDTFPSIPKMMGLDSAYVYFATYGNTKNNVKKKSNIYH